MPSYFTLTKDTTSPTITVSLPTFAHPNNIEYIKVESNEQLSNIQEFYFIDSNGTRHDVTLEFKNTYFDGNCQLTDFPNGLSVFYAKVYDEVLNQSSLSSNEIYIYDIIQECILTISETEIVKIDSNETEVIKIDDNETEVIKHILNETNLIKIIVQEKEVVKIDSTETKLRD